VRPTFSEIELAGIVTEEFRTARRGFNPETFQDDYAACAQRLRQREQVTSGIPDDPRVVSGEQAYRELLAHAKMRLSGQPGVGDLVAAQLRAPDVAAELQYDAADDPWLARDRAAFSGGGE